MSLNKQCNNKYDCLEQSYDGMLCVMQWAQPCKPGFLFVIACEGIKTLACEVCYISQV